MTDEKNIAETSEEIEAIAHDYSQHSDPKVRRMAMSLIRQSRKREDED